MDPGDIPVPKDTSTVEPGAELPGDLPLRVRIRQTPVTFGLLAVCILMYALTFADILLVSADPLDTAMRSLWTLSLDEGTETFRRFGALELSRVWLDHEWWRVLTTGFLHGSLLHLVLNGIALISIGEWIEQAWGRWAAFSLFMLASIAGCLASLAWCESPVVVGASAGVLGQAGALWLGRTFGSPRLREQLNQISTLGLGLVILFCLGLGLFIPGIAQAGHFGGLAAGLLLGTAWTFSQSATVRVGSVLLTAGGLALLAWLGSAPLGRANFYTILGFRLLDDGRAVESLNYFKRGLELEPESAQFRNAIAYQLALDGVELPTAEKLSRDAVERDPLNPSYLDTLAWIWCRQGLTEAGIRTLHAAAWLSDDDFPELTEHLQNCPLASLGFQSTPLE